MSLLLGGKLVAVDGLTIIPPASHGGPSWAKLGPEDYQMRKTTWVRQLILHTTKGTWPQSIIPGSGKGGRDKVVADYWRLNPDGTKHSAAPIVVDNDGSIVCLGDLLLHHCYHAKKSNEWSIGVETYQESNGGVYEAAMAATVRLAFALTRLVPTILFQIPSRAYPNAPLRRMVADGGKDVVGIVGHRDNTHERGRGDPGDEVFRRLRALGAEALDYDAGEDLARWKPRQRFLNAMIAQAGGAKLSEDGIAGPATVAAMRRFGFPSGPSIPA